MGATHSPRPTRAVPSATQAATAFDDIHEARLLLDDTYGRGHEAGRLLGRLEAVVLMALTAGVAGVVWWAVGS